MQINWCCSNSFSHVQGIVRFKMCKLHRIYSFFQHTLKMKNFALKANYCWLSSVSWPHNRWIKFTWKKWCIINLNHCLTAQLISQLKKIWIINLTKKLIKSVKTVARTGKIGNNSSISSVTVKTFEMSGDYFFGIRRMFYYLFNA